MQAVANVRAAQKRVLKDEKHVLDQWFGNLSAYEHHRTLQTNQAIFKQNEEISSKRPRLEVNATVCRS